ncbi:MAG: tripartite tricarboxylate transporter substrate binding protein [Peptococcaceae bacterium]
MKTLVNRKFVCFIIFTLLVALLLTGCNENTAKENTPNDEPQKEAEKQYPTRPIELIVPWGPGGGADQLARILSKELEPVLGVSLPVINVPGASGGVGMNKLITAPNDGYTIAIYTLDTHATLVNPNASYQYEDITPAARMVKVPSYIFVPVDSPIKSWNDFERIVKEKPGEIKAAITGDGTVDDITFKFLENKHGIQVNKIPFPNPGERYTSILGGHADILFEQAGDVIQYIEEKQIRPIIVFNEERVSEFPDVPCTGELGIELYLPFSRSIIAKAGTDPEKVKLISEALEKVYNDSEDLQKFLQKNRATEDSYANDQEAKKALDQDLESMAAALN